MNNILKSTVAMPFKFLKGLMEMMKAVLNTILKLFGHPGLATGGEHSARVEKPEDALDDKRADKNALSNKPSMELANQYVSANTLSKVKTYLHSKERNPTDLATLSKSMKLYMSTLSSDKLDAMSKLSDDNLKLQIFNDLKEFKTRQKQMIKPAAENIDVKSDEPQDDIVAKKKTALRRKMQAHKQASAPSLKMSFAM